MIDKERLAALEAESILQLADEIIKKHRLDGCDSHLDPSVIAKLSYRLEQAKHFHQECEKYKTLCHQAEHRRDEILGVKGGSAQESLVMDYLQAVLPQWRKG